MRTVLILIAVIYAPILAHYVGFIINDVGTALFSISIFIALIMDIIDLYTKAKK